MDLLCVLILILIAEYFGDFLFQDRDIAKRKSSELSSLFYHGAIIYCSVMVLAGIPMWWLYGIEILNPLVFLSLSYALIHMIQDWYIWRIFKKLIRSRIRKESKIFISKINLDREEPEDNIVKNRL